MELGPNNKTKMLIGGDLVDSVGGEWIEAINPATEELIGYIPSGQPADVDKAVAAAQAAQPEWAALSVQQRIQMLRQVGTEIAQQADEIARVEVMDNGKTIKPLRGNIAWISSLIEHYTGLATEVKGITVPSSPGNLHYTMREPYGVVGRITPFNHPFGFAASGCVIPAVMGNTVVLKCPETSSLTSTLFAEICADILPPGVVNIITGYGATAGDALARHPDVKRIAFTGSVATGQKVQRAAAEGGIKHVTLELGGKNPLIVFADADVDKAVDGAIRGMNFAWQSQSCGSTSRVFLHESIHDTFLKKLVDQVAAIRVGDPLDPDSHMGPINSNGQYEKVMGYIASAKDQGARLMTGGSRPEGAQFERGFWVRPTVFADVTMDMTIANEEIFGPVIAVFKWTDYDHVIHMANATQYGLTASIWTHDLDLAHKTAQRIRTGYVWINDAAQHYPGMPFGGYKNSGVGRQETGIEELLSYTEEKSVNLILN